MKEDRVHEDTGATGSAEDTGPRDGFARRRSFSGSASRILSEPHLQANGLVAVSAEGSALNMNAIDGTGKENKVQRAKSFSEEEGGRLPYASSQLYRRMWRQSISSWAGWELSPLEYGSGDQIYTQAQPVEFADDDVFGYMRTATERRLVDKPDGSQEWQKVKGGNKTLSRNSPLGNKPFIAIGPTRIVADRKQISRHEGSPAMFRSEIYRAILSGGFSLDLAEVGRFRCGRRTGEQHVSTETFEEMAEVEGIEVERDPDILSLPVDERRRRVRETLGVIADVSGGANRTLGLTDLTPKLVLLAVVKGGNNPLLTLMGSDGTASDPSLDTAQLRQILEARATTFRTDVFLGIRAGFLDHQMEELEGMVTDFPASGDSETGILPDGEARPGIRLLTPESAVGMFTEAAAELTE